MVNVTAPITEQDLGRDFDAIRKQMDELLQNYPELRQYMDARENVEATPVVIQPVFIYEIHASA